MVNRYYCVKRPKSIKSSYELLVFDQNNNPFIPLTEYYADCVKRYSVNTAKSYLNRLMEFFTWVGMAKTNQLLEMKWDSNPEMVRVAVEYYLMDELGCKVAAEDSYLYVNHTHKSPLTVKSFLSAMKSFYKFACRASLYKFDNPLIDIQSVINSANVNKSGERLDAPRMPEISGTEEPISYRKITDSYFKMGASEWEPHIINDPYLPDRVLEAGHAVGWTLREKIVTLMLFETGARVSEVVELLIGDYRKAERETEAMTFSKGSYGKRVKYIQFSPNTAKLLKHYINHERIKYTTGSKQLNDLNDNDPIFVTSRGTGLKREAWFYHWNKAMKYNGLKLNPHKARHWFVTTRMKMIYERARDESEFHRYKEQLIVYMKWRHQDTVKAYEHYFNQEEGRLIQLEMHEKMKHTQQEYIKNKNKLRQKLFVDYNTHSTEQQLLETDVEEFFNELD
ncbi:tyrosine-type recombinase/integrase [Bacillus vallismortis]|uniref:tyrosine-type recombinase/integrase n=1 Tax=Bacillus vallismortis TaxID=72361 RepID=UPI002280E902|nr:tyrosine-type recombinase/integrase [Bacillus vallismortis]MCY7893118.1 tyrosine-type recombinase/integrase [Bacillus vallismortis]